MNRPSREAMTGAVLAPVLFTAYCVALGYRQVFTMVAREVGVTGVQWAAFVALYGGGLAVAGGVAAGGWRRGFRVPAPVAVLGLLAVPWVAPVSPGFAGLFSFTPYVAVVAVVVLAAAGTEWLLQRRESDPAATA